MKSKTIIFVLFWLWLLFNLASFARAQDRNIRPLNPLSTKLTQDSKLYDNSYALIVGVSTYDSEKWRYLPNASRDAEEVEAVLKMHGFETTLLLDPTKRSLVDSMNNFFHNDSLTENDRLLFYFAGHGHSIKNRLGYIVPKDALTPQKPESFKISAISLDQFKIYADATPAKHVLFVFDSCFSGRLFSQQRGSIHRSAPIEIKLTEPVRQFITAGGAKENVPDVSIFKQFFIEGIQGEADRDEDGFVSVRDELHPFLFSKVTIESNSKQHPQRGKIPIEGAENGDFIFKVPKNVLEWTNLLSSVENLFGAGQFSDVVDSMGSRLANPLIPLERRILAYEYVALSHLFLGNVDLGSKHFDAIKKLRDGYELSDELSERSLNVASNNYRNQKYEIMVNYLLVLLSKEVIPEKYRNSNKLYIALGYAKQGMQEKAKVYFIDILRNNENFRLYEKEEINDDIRILFSEAKSDLKGGFSWPWIAIGAGVATSTVLGFVLIGGDGPSPVANLGKLPNPPGSPD